MRPIISAAVVSAVLLAWGLPSVPAQAEQQRVKQASSPQQGNKETRDARNDKEPTAQDQRTKPSRDTSGLKDTPHHQKTSTPEENKDSRDARDDKESGGSSRY